MKKLEKLKLKVLEKSFTPLDQSKTIELKGGAGEQEYYEKYGGTLPEYTSYDWVTDTCYYDPLNFNYTSTPTQTTTNDNPTVCPQCEAFRLHNEQNSLGGVDGDNVMTPFGEFIFNTLPHNMGWGNHIDIDGSK